jgi:hypothetical protein
MRFISWKSDLAGWRKDWILPCCFLLFAVFLATALVPAILQLVPAEGDGAVFHYPIRHWYAVQLKAGENFIWNQSIHGGMSALGEGQAGMLHPLHLLLFWALAPATAYHLLVASSYLVLAMGALRLFRSLEIRREIAFVGAFWASYGGYMSMRLDHPNALETWAHLPWLLWLLVCMGKASGAGQQIRIGAALGLVTVSQCLMGHPPFLYLSALAECAFVAMLLLTRQLSMPAFLATGLGKGLGIFGALVQLVPTWEQSKSTERAQKSFLFLANGSLEPALFLQWLNPAFTFGDHARLEFNVYAGTGVLLLAAWSCANPPRRRSWLYFWLGFGALMLFVALGRFNGLFSSYYDLPPFSLFRMAVRHFGLTQLAMVGIALMGMERFLGDGGPLPPTRKAVSWLGLGFAACSAGLLVLRLLSQFPLLNVALPKIPLAVVGTLMVSLTGICFFGAARSSSPQFRKIFVLVALLEPALFYGQWHARQPMQPLDSVVQRVGPPPPTGIESPVADEPGRTVHLITKGYRLSSGYVPLEPESKLGLKSPLFEKLLGVQARRELVKSPWLRGYPPMPRVWLVGETLPRPTREADWENSDFLRVAYLEAPLPRPLSMGAQGKVVPRKLANGFLMVETRTDGAMLMIAGDRFHKHWQGRVDGRDPLEVVRVNGDLIGVVVPAGTHQIDLFFSPPYLAILGWISASAVLILLVGWLFPLTRNAIIQR